VVIRDTPQVIRLAEKLVTAMDLPEPEVMLEVELLDVDRARALDLGIDWPSSFAASIPAGTLAALHGITAAAINVTGLAVTANAHASNSDTRTLASPSIRVRNKEKAKIMIGARTPVISSAAVPGTNAGVAAVYNTNIQYLETGVKLEVEPTVYLDGNVAIKINLEVSDLGTQITVPASGTVAYPTTTNNAVTVLRLKDGETQILGGLLRAFDSNGQANKVPGLGDIPFFGRLFGTGSDSWENRELVLAITAHIVRNNQASEADLLELWSGTESNIKFGESSLNAAGTAGVISQGTTGTLAPRPAPVMPNRSQVPAPVPVIPGPSAAPPPPSAAVPSADTSLSSVLSGPLQARVGDRINITVVTHGTAAVNTVSFVLDYDSEVLKAIAVNEGDLMRNTGVKSTFDADIDESGGKVVAVLATETASASGNGNIATIQFEVIGAQRPAVVSVSAIAATSGGSAEVSVANPKPLSIAIQPSP
jgi:general secretion pathway protein D